MAWFDDMQLPGTRITGFFGFVTADGPDTDQHPDVTPATGTVTFTPTATAVKADGAWIGIAPVTATIVDGTLFAPSGIPELRILSTDADTNVQGWGWKASFRIDGARLPEITFQAPAGQTVDLTSKNLIPFSGHPVEVILPEVGQEMVIAEVTAQVKPLSTAVARLGAVNTITGEGAPVGNATVGQWYVDALTGENYQYGENGWVRRRPASIQIGTRHLDQVTEPGTYMQHRTADATTDRGYPWPFPGVLRVMDWQPGVPMQIYYTRNQATYRRTMYLGQWEPWRKEGAP